MTHSECVHDVVDRGGSVQKDLAVGQNQWYHFGVGAGAPPILVLVEIGMFTGGTIWVLTHGHLDSQGSGRIAVRPLPVRQCPDGVYRVFCRALAESSARD